MDSVAKPAPATVEPTFNAEWELWRLRMQVPAWLRDNPGLVLTLVYVGASLIGIVFNFLYFRRFGVNVLEFSEASDFLMVVVREPLTVALAMMGVPIYLGYMSAAAAVTAWAKRRWPKLRGTPEKQEKSYRMMARVAPALQILFIGVYAFAFVVWYSKHQANRVKAPERERVTIEYRADVPTSRPPPVKAVLIGTTSRFVFLYFRETKEAEAVPVDAIARLTWDARFGVEKTEASSDVVTPGK